MIILHGHEGILLRAKRLLVGFSGDIFQVNFGIFCSYLDFDLIISAESPDLVFFKSTMFSLPLNFINF